MTKTELEKEAKTECFMLTANTIGIDQRDVELAYVMGAEPREKRIAELEAQIEKMKWHRLDWDKVEENPDVDKLVRVKTRSGAEYICETYSYFPTEDEIGYGSVITQFEELNGDWVDDNEIEYWCYIEPFKEIEE